MLSPSELTSLFNLISDDSKSFENVLNVFEKTYSKSDEFKIGITLWFLIKDNLLNLSQMIISFLILNNVFKNENKNIFPLILDRIKNTKNQIEKKFLINLLKNNLNSKISIKNLIEEMEKSSNDEKNFDIDNFNNFTCNKEKIDGFFKDWIRPVIYDNKNNSNENNSKPFNFSQLIPQELSFNYFEPNYMRFYPNSSNEFYDEEPLWIAPNLNHNFLYDFNNNKCEKEILFNFLSKELNNFIINESEKKKCLLIIEKNVNILKEINFTPEKFMILIENDQNFAINLILKLKKNVLIEEYLSQFLIKNFSAKSMNVLKEIIENVSLPKSFINKYIKHVINDFKESDDKNKMARLILNFVVKLLESKLLLKEEFNFDEIENLFCVSNEEIDKLKKKIIEIKQK
jgi:hypothetical protein